MKRGALLVLLALFFAVVAPRAARAEEGDGGASGQGILVLGRGEARAEAFELARAIYASSLRPRGLDEIRARVLAGDPLPANATRELRDLAEVRGAITGEDAASRRLLSGIGQQLKVQALLVVSIEGDPEAGAPSPVARLFLPVQGEFDAARYEAEAAVDGGRPSWRGTVLSLERRFPAAPAPATQPSKIAAVTLPSDSKEKESKPFYASGWFWGAIAGAALLGGAIFFATRDTGDDTIHLQMRVR